MEDLLEQLEIVTKQTMQQDMKKHACCSIQYVYIYIYIRAHTAFTVHFRFIPSYNDSVEKHDKHAQQTVVTTLAHPATWLLQTMLKEHCSLQH